MRDKNKYHLDFIIDHGFSMFELSSILEPFSLAADSDENLSFDITIYSSDGLPKRSNCQSDIATEHIGTRDHKPSMVFILSPCRSAFASSLLLKKLTPCLADPDCMIIAVDEGIEWLYQSALIGNEYIHSGILEPTNNGSVRLKKARLYAIRNNIALCTGGSTCLDLTLKLISNIHDKETSINTAEKLACPMIRASKNHRFETTTNPINWPQELRDAVQIMRDNLRQPLSVPEIYSHLNITAYHLHMLFKKHISISPIQYYSELRLMKVQELLSESNLSMVQIADQTGYSNLNTLYNRFKKRFGASPCSFKKYSTL